MPPIHLPSLPKVELHLHLEACLRLPTLRKIAERNAVPLPLSLATGDAHYFDTFEEFVAVFQSIGQALRKESDFVDLVQDLILYIKENNIVYCEVSWTPYLYMRRGMSFSRIMGIMNEELIKNNLQHSVFFIIDTQRDHGSEVADLVFGALLAEKSANIVGVGLTGFEHSNDPALFKSHFAKAKEQGLGCTAHAGEYGTAWDIWQCIKELGVSRIGHGLAARQDEALMDYAAEHQIHFEISLTSNLRLKRAASPAEHPLPYFRKKGMSLGLNSDDPAIFNCSISSEFQNVINWYNYNLLDLQEMTAAASRARFGGLTKNNEA